MSEASAESPAPKARRRKLRFFVASSILCAFAAAWTYLFGFFQLEVGQQAILQRAGRVVAIVTTPGRHVHWPFPLERRSVVAVDDREFRIGVDAPVALVTRDGQLVHVAYRVAYRVSDAVHYRFGVNDAERAVEGAIRAAVVRAVAQQEFSELVGTGTRVLPPLLVGDLRQSFSSLGLGVDLDSGQAVEILAIAAPDALEQSEEALVAARERRDLAVGDAEVAAANLIDAARASADQQRGDAQAEYDRRIARAEAEATSFRALAQEYKKAPEVVRTRLYLETMEEVLSSARVVVAEPGTAIPPEHDDGAGGEQ